MTLQELFDSINQQLADIEKEKSKELPETIAKKETAHEH